MANPKHPKVLKRSMEEGNQWRKSYLDVRANLSEAVYRVKPCLCRG